MWLLLACRPPIEGAGPTLYGLTVDETDIPQVFRVRFDTERDASPRVRADAGPAAVEVDGPSGTAHDVLVAGLVPGTTARFTVSATGPGGTTEAPPIEVEVPPLADDDPVPEVLVAPDDRSAGGWTVLDVNRNGTGSLQALLVDEAGHVVWQYDPRRGEDVGAVDVQVTDTDRILVAGSVPEGERPVELALDGAVTWEGPVQPAFDDDGFMHHHTDPTGRAGHVFLEKDVRAGIRGDRVVVRDAAGDVTWSWSTWDHWEVPPGELEWTHLNWVDLRDDVFYLSDQHSSRIWKIDRRTGEPVWVLGADGDFTLRSGSWFSGQHAPEWGPDGRLWVYDNGRGGGRSRVVAYTLDEAGRTADQVFAWDGGAEWAWYTGYWGDVDILPNGNLLVAAGNPDARRVMEVDPASGDVVAALALPPPFAFYRASRVDPARWRIRALEAETE